MKPLGCRYSAQVGFLIHDTAADSIQVRPVQISGRVTGNLCPLIASILQIGYLVTPDMGHSRAHRSSNTACQVAFTEI